MITGLVSTITPVYNRPTLLVETVNSVLSQTYRPVEIVIVDDGSTDDTPRVARRLVEQHPQTVRYITQANAGPGKSRQTGLEVSRGEFVQFLDSDDLLMPRKFERQVSLLRSEPNSVASYGKSRRYRIGTRPRNVPYKRTGERLDGIFPAALQSRWWTTSTPLFRRSVLDRVGPWTNLRNEEDWEYECRIGALGLRLVYCDDYVSDQRDHEHDQLSRNGSTDPAKLKDRAEAHRLIYQHARRASIRTESPEMQHFARELFLLARQCGSAGLADEARMLFGLSREASGAARGNGLDYRVYNTAASLLGWTTAGRIACQLDRFRPSQKETASQ